MPTTPASFEAAPTVVKAQDIQSNQIAGTSKQHFLWGGRAHCYQRQTVLQKLGLRRGTYESRGHVNRHHGGDFSKVEGEKTSCQAVQQEEEKKGGWQSRWTKLDICNRRELESYYSMALTKRLAQLSAIS
ncbi:hypothetical protein MAM1_0272c09047 [Mucor ambiguus]|uniref:Uncharacterized protein n=1 Tax=Mucor ambiguus TaxID=91626 RepID=A0A0C9N0S6_9FUNG|nr:hypothetical protein MAM1_0272c09047 [Mucor ambiguus]